MTPAPEDTPVPLADAELARQIADGVREGGAAERSPTLDQLLIAFREPEATLAARERITAALDLAGISSEPGIGIAKPGQRVTLTVRGSGGRQPRKLSPVAGLVVIALVIGAAAVAQQLLKSDDDSTADTLPLTTTTALAAPAKTTPTATATTPTATATTPAKTTSTKTATTPARKPAAKPAPKRVSVRFVPPADKPTYICVKDGDAIVYAGTLSAPRVFRGKLIRVNLGLNSTAVTVNGKPVALTGSPAGFEARPGGRVTQLAESARPSC